ncbi:hypothetical protein Lfu02_43580 [Longispora fulva]|uniref:DUF2568 domain-containing protein n=1 Tax=Longispora fulva TaxID=619741 RepID=A0A8J7GTC1_9ACTN|nr:YrdB family protein [Longispora fulva]MBG6136816.1 hypothetical protein [Longispora fulva]GIG59986.1 hypothetical protein Lfu02_43580 [Longispora fulva]
MKNLNLAVLFLLELATLAAAGYAGLTLDAGWPVRILVGLGAPAALVALWWLFGAPRASRKTHGMVRVAFEVAWFGSGAVALAVAGRTVLAAVFAAVFVVSKALALIWRQ